MNRRAFIQSVTAGLTAIGIGRRPCEHGLSLVEPKNGTRVCAGCGVRQAVRANGVLVDTPPGISMRYQHGKWFKGSPQSWT